MVAVKQRMEWRIINEYDQMDNYDVLIKSDETQWQYFCFASFQSKEEMTSAHIEIKIMS